MGIIHESFIIDTRLAICLFLFNTLLVAAFLYKGSRKTAPGYWTAAGDSADISSPNKDAMLYLQSAALKAADNTVIITDRKGDIVWVNPTFTKLTGYSCEEVMGKNPRLLKSGKHDHQYYKALWDTINSGKVWHSEIVNRRKDGRVYTEEMTITPVMDAKKQITNFIAIKQDISERKWAEDAIREQFIFLQNLIDTIPNPIYYKTRNGRYAGCNIAFENWIGLKKKDIVGTTVFDIVPRELAEKYHALDLELLEKGGIQKYESEVRKKNGQSRTALFYKATYPDTSKAVAGVVGVILDITDRKKMEQDIALANQNLVKNEKLFRQLITDLEKANQELKETQNQLLQSEKLVAMGTLSSGIAHEIKNPLGIILLSADSLENRIKSGMLDMERSGQYIHMIRDAAQRANKIIVELLKFSRFSEINLETLSLIDVIRNAVVLIKNRAKMKSIEFVEEFPAGNVNLRGDPILLEQAFVNLLANAIDAIDDNGRVTIKVVAAEHGSSPTGRDVRVEVIDSGIGMPEEVMKRIFEPFFTTKEQGRGTGLGLSTTYTIVQKHNGSIRVDSRVGAGTTFTITLPLSTG